MIPRASYEDAIAAVDACDGLPDAGRYQLNIRSLRLLASQLHKRDDHDIERWLIQYLDVADTVPIGDRIRCVYAACASSARLAATYLPPLIAEARAAVDTATTEEERRLLMEESGTALTVCARLGVDVDLT